ncbi:hypothetical protein MWN34_10595 [Ancylobacter sp. 6x-1]|uniref:Uncharacterized protein n=1 Tax=Ancylobacter crimeensis TaxID=2579147 RepID=A0ABT0DBP5_9HYPH|nr:hypothetical protein [Ancylobacter crimeensis]MCK0197360.1 hypothetical protein [Ancylobacter crimeensis]
MTATPKDTLELSWSDFLDRYTPMTNSLYPAAAFDGLMFETYGEEWDFVRAQPRERVWTIIDDGDCFAVINGLSISNRLGYLVTIEPVATGLSVFVDLEAG